MPIRVLIVDDHPVVRAGLRAVIDASGTIETVGEAASGAEAVAKTTQLEPDVVLCDLRLGPGMDGIGVTAALRAMAPAPAVVIVTTFDREADVTAAVAAGAIGYLVKDAPPGAILDAIRAAAAGRLYLPPEISARLAQRLRNPRPQLTDREHEVLRLLATGASNKEIARALFVTEATVKSHLVRVFTKLEVGSRARAVHVAREAGLLP